MKLEDTELLEYVRPPAKVTPFKMESNFCRTNRCHGCTWSACECQCHKESREQLAHQLSRVGHRLCVTEGCIELARGGSNWCADCSNGLTPKVKRERASHGEKQ